MNINASIVILIMLKTYYDHNNPVSQINSVVTSNINVLIYVQLGDECIAYCVYSLKYEPFILYFRSSFQNEHNTLYIVLKS